MAQVAGINFTCFTGKKVQITGAKVQILTERKALQSDEGVTVFGKESAGEHFLKAGMRPQATRLSGLKLLVYKALWLRPELTYADVCW